MKFKPQYKNDLLSTSPTLEMARECIYNYFYGTGENLFKLTPAIGIDNLWLVSKDGWSGNYKYHVIKKGRRYRFERVNLD